MFIYSNNAIVADLIILNSKSNYSKKKLFK